MTEREARIAFNMIPAVGAVTVARLAAEAGGSVAAAYERYPRKQDWEGREPDWARELERAEKMHVRIVTEIDPGYPPQLGTIASPPLALYVVGDPAALAHPGVALVGTRAATAYGRDVAERFAFGLAQRGWVVVSGLARGIDAAAHRGALAGGGVTVGVLGGTGSGKSSLVQLIARLYDATEGAVLVGGCDVRDYDLVALRDAVGIVLQKNVLFTGTVRENLQWGAPDATDEELLRACRAACVDEFLDRIGGLDGELGQGGAGVSGGQKQRLCIARTLLKHPRVLIFDDSTSAVDMVTDAKIREHIAQIPDTTVIIIAQRIASVMDADRIVVLDDGRVHGVGTHEELLAGDNIYQEIYASQMEFAGDADDGDDGADGPFSSVPSGSIRAMEEGERHA